MKVSILGAGHMGSAMAARLADTGHDVTIWDRHRDQSSHLTSPGIAVAGDAASAVADASVVITSRPARWCQATISSASCTTAGSRPGFARHTTRTPP